MNFALLRLWKLFWKSFADDCCAVAPLEVALYAFGSRSRMMFTLLRLWKSFADDYCTVAPLEVVCGWLFAPVRIWKSLADDFHAIATLEVVCG
jgi:hypothetical protein